MSLGTRSYRVGAALGCVVLGSLCLALSQSQPAFAKSPCDVADALRGAGLLAQADTLYRKIKAAPCAKDGIKAIDKERARRARQVIASLESDEVVGSTATSLAAVVRRGGEEAIPRVFSSEIRAGLGFAIARALKVSGYPEVAQAVVAKTIKADPSAEIPADLTTLSDAQLHLDAAEALSRVGLDTEANAELTTALTEDPGLDVPDELASPKRQTPWWRRWLGAAGPWLVSIAEMVIAALAAVALVLLLCRVPGRFRVRLIIDPFTSDAKPDATTDPGPDMTVAVRENYGRLREQSGGKALRMVSSSGEVSIGLPPEVAKDYPQAALIAALVGFVDRLAPSRTRKAIGYLRPRDPVRGAGLTLTLARRYGKVFDEITIWESEYGPWPPHGENDPAQPAYDRLAVPAATWLMYETGNLTLRRWLGRRLRVVRGSLPRSFWEFQILATKEWRSYALFAVGAEMHDRDVKGARRRYLQALRYDRANRGAKFNLAISELEGGAQ